MESGLITADGNLDSELDYSDPFAIWGDGNLDEPISDEDRTKLLDCVGIK